MTKYKFKRYGINIIEWTIIVAIINGIICYLGKCTPKEALVMPETKIILWPLYAFTLFLILNYLVTVLFNLTKLPKIPGGEWKKEELIVCRYCSYEGALFPVMFAVGSVTLVTVIKIGLVKPQEEGPVAYFVYGFLLLLMISIVVMSGMFLVNCVFIFYPEGVVSRNMFGKTTYVTSDKILYVTHIDYLVHHGRAYLRLHTKEKELYVNAQASNYELAKTYAYKRYVDFKTYQQKNER